MGNGDEADRWYKDTRTMAAITSVQTENGMVMIGGQGTVWNAWGGGRGQKEEEGKGDCEDEQQKGFLHFRKNNLKKN